MSDERPAGAPEGSPSPGGASPPPPPPPPDLQAPPGYAGYQPPAAPGVTLRSPSGAALGSIIAAGISAAIGLIVALVNLGAVDAARDYLDNPNSTTADALDDASNIGNVLGMLSIPAQITAVVFTLIFTNRLLENHRRIGRNTTWGGGWGVGGWFAPPFLYVIPLLFLREAWKASDPDVDVRDERWRNNGENPMLWAWWILYGPVQLLLTVLSARAMLQTFSFSTDQDEVRENIARGISDSAGWSVAQSVGAVLAAVAWFIFVRQLTARHERLAGVGRR